MLKAINTPIAKLTYFCADIEIKLNLPLLHNILITD